MYLLTKIKFKDIENITDFIGWLCSWTYLTEIIYILMFVLFVWFIYIIWKQFKKSYYVDSIIELLTSKTNTPKEIEELSHKPEKTNEEKLEIVRSNFPILVEELDCIYNGKEKKQISAIDICENNIVISEDKEMTIKAIINSFTPLGLLGTFIGLMNSINSIDANQTTKGIELLLNSIGPAIGTTIVGVILTIITTSTLTALKTKYKSIAIDLEQQMMQDDKIKIDVNPDYFYDNFTTFTGRKYTEALSKIVKNFLEQMKGSLTDDLEAYKNKINDSINSLVNNEEKFNTAAQNLTTTVGTINTYLEKTTELNNEFEIKLQEFTEALDKFNYNFKESTQESKVTLESIKTINEQNIKMNETTFETLKKQLVEMTSAFENIKDMNINLKNEILKTPSQLDDSIKYACQNIEAISTKINTVPKDLEESVNNLCNIIHDFSTKFNLEESNKNINDLAKKVDKLTKKIDNIDIEK